MLHLGHTAISVTLVLVPPMLFLAPALCEAIDLIQHSASGATLAVTYFLQASVSYDGDEYPYAFCFNFC